MSFMISSPSLRSMMGDRSARAASPSVGSPVSGVRRWTGVVGAASATVADAPRQAAVSRERQPRLFLW
jgi:hypothetical protein